jgi:phosphoserine phosphatase RsbU/P
MIGEYPWGSDALLAATLREDGTVTAANATLERFAGRTLAGERFDVLVAPAQREAFGRHLAEVDEEWRAAVFALQGAGDRAASDHALWLRLREGGLLLVAEPPLGEQARLVEEVLALNADLVDAHRRLVRQHEDLHAATERVRQLEAISAAGLAHLRLGEVLDDVLRAIARGLRADRAAVLLLDEEGGLRVEAAVGPADASMEPLVAAAAGGRISVGPGGAAVPLRVERTVIGVLEVGGPGTRFEDDDLTLLVAASERVAVAISRGQVHERERRISETLQRALLPARLPDVTGFSLAARYEPGTDIEVGGDWYDALPLPNGEVALAIGDVAGKGVRAAVLMGELRGGLRAYALDAGGPDEVLARLDRLASEARHEMATVALAMLDPGTGDFRYASAGHLPPLLVDADGSAALLSGGSAGPLLAYHPAGSATAHLDPGACLLLYTDGLVERRGEVIDNGLNRLLRTADGYRGAPGPLCDALLERMHSDAGGPQDDVAVIAVQRSAAA